MDFEAPIFSWPGGHRAATSILVHVPGFGFSEDGTSQEDLIGLDYTADGIRRLFRVFEDFDISATFAFTADAIVDAPSLVSEAAARNHEVAGSLCSASGSLSDLLSNLEDESGVHVNGIVAKLPGFPTSELDEPWGNDSGKAWVIDGHSGDLPTLQRDPDATLIPISPYLLDTAWLSPARPLPPSSFLETLMLSLEAHRQEGTYMPVIVHPHIIARPAFVSTLTRYIDDVVSHGDVWLARMDHIAATWQTMTPESR